MKPSPLVSVVVPVTKCAYLMSAIESITNQSYPNIELVVVDNKADGDVQTLAESARFKNLQFHQRTSQLPALKNWNDTVRRSSGTYVLILSDDDILLPYAIEQLVRRLEDTHLDVAVGSVATIDEKGTILTISNSCPELEIPSSWIYHRFSGQRSCVLSNFLFSRKAFDDVGGFDESGYAWGADNDLFFRIAMHSGKIAGINDVCLLYRTSGTNLSSVMASQIKTQGNDWLLEKISKEIASPHTPFEPPYDRGILEKVFQASRKESSKGTLFELFPWHFIDAIKFLISRKDILSWRDFLFQFLFSLNSLNRR